MQIDNKVQITREGREEIERVINIAADSGSNFHGMTYEEGVRAALDWIMGNQAENPFE